MIPAAACTAIVIAFIAVFGVIIPILNKKIPDYVSYRWCVVVVVLSLAVGVTINFGELSESSRGTILTGALVIAGGYIVLRSIEKALANGWLHGIRLDARKGDASITLHQGDRHEDK